MEKRIYRISLIGLSGALVWVYFQIPETSKVVEIKTIKTVEKSLGLVPPKCLKVTGSDGSELHLSVSKGQIMYGKPGSSTVDCL